MEEKDKLFDENVLLKSPVYQMHKLITKTQQTIDD